VHELVINEKLCNVISCWLLLKIKFLPLVRNF